jgi:hypothetical protein
MSFSPYFDIYFLMAALSSAEEVARGVGQFTADFFSSEGIILLVASGGWVFECLVALLKDRRFKDVLFIPFVFFFGLIMQITNTIAVFKALLGMKHSFYKTPKMFYRVE